MLGHSQEACDTIPDDFEGDDWPYNPLLKATPGKIRRVTVGISETTFREQSRVNKDMSNSNRWELFGVRRDKSVGAHDEGNSSSGNEGKAIREQIIL